MARASMQYSATHMVGLIWIALLLQTPFDSQRETTRLAGLAQGAATAEQPAAEIAPGWYLIRGVPMPGRGPDGNTVIIDAPDGLIVIDTGRHTQHSDKVLAFARDRQRPIAAIVNTHWHLDHSSGNRRLKTAYPDATLYTTTAIDRALAPGGFLVRNLDNTRKAVATTTDEVRRDEMQIFIATMDARDSLRPDVPLTRSGPVRIAGRAIDLRVTDKAVSDADAWIFDAPSKVAVIGDLVTVPIPYFETACPDRWQASLDEVWATPFEQAVPGHGPVLSRTEFDVYRQSFGAFIACVRSDAPAAQCGAAWADGVKTLIGADAKRREAVIANAEYYVGYLRPNGGKAPDCLAR
jgi:glyoxylase-like metal-dependent hydrolase (beta-lactamase superfamily II)